MSYKQSNDYVRKCVALYLYDNVDTEHLLYEIYDYLTNGAGDNFADKMHNRDIDTIVEDVSEMCDLDVPDCKNMTELYDFMSTQSEEDVMAFYEIISDFDWEVADLIVNGYDSWGTYNLPYDMADYILGNNGTSEILKQCEQDNDFSDDHYVEVFENKFINGKNLDDIALEVCKNVEIPNLQAIN